VALDNQSIVFDEAQDRMEIAESGTPIFNWALENTDKTKSIYKGIWIAILGKDQGFDEFYTDCQQVENMTLTQDKNGKPQVIHTTKGFKVNGTSFQTEILRRIKEQDSSATKYKYDEKGRLEKSSIKEIARNAIASLNIEELKSQGLDSDMIRIYLSQMAVDGYLPFDTVTTAGQAVSDGQHLQMGCGEGKTGVLFFSAAHQALTGKQVFLTSSTTNLATDTIIDTIDKYEFMGFNQNSDEVVLITDNKVYYPKRDENGDIVHNDKGKPELNDPINLSTLSPQEKQAVLQVAYSKKIVIADNATIMQHQMGGFIPAAQRDKYGSVTDRILFADEADYVLLDQFRPAQQLGGVCPDQEIRYNYRKIARQLMVDFVANHPDCFKVDDSNQYCDFTSEGKRILHQMIESIAKDPQLQVELDKQLLADLTHEALVVETVYRENRDYQITTDKDGNTIIISEDRASGANINLPQGIAQALAIKEGTSYPVEHQVLNATNVSAVFNQLFGRSQVCVSGTLATSKSQAQKQELAEKTSGDTYDCSARDINSRQMNPRRIFASREQQRKEIINTALEHRSKQIEGQENCYQPVLIGCVSDDEVNKIVKELENQHSQLSKPRIITFTASSENEFQKLKSNPDKFREVYGVEPDAKIAKDFNSYIKNYCGMSSSNCIIVGTSIVGRGTTIKLGDKDIDQANLETTKALGGIHVIINGLHETSSRNQIQYAARAARGEDPGSVDEYMCIEDFPAELLSSKGILVINGNVYVRHSDESVASITQKEIDDLYDDYYTSVDTRQSNVRKHTDELITNIQAQKGTIESQLRAKLQQTNMSQKEIDLRVTMAVAFMTQRGFQIQNRACGYDGNYKENEYFVEMDAFAQMYIEQYSMENPQEFNPQEFLTRPEFNGKYDNIIGTYFEFSTQEKIKIITDSLPSDSNITKEELLNFLQSSEVTKKSIAENWEITASALSEYANSHELDSR